MEQGRVLASSGAGAGASSSSSSAAAVVVPGVNRIAGQGESASLLAAHKSTIALFFKFRSSSGLLQAHYPFSTWEGALEHLVCTTFTVESFAYYLTHEHKKAGAEFLSAGTLTQYLSNFMNAAKRRFPTNPFFACMDPADSNNWYKQLLKSVTRTVAKRALKAGLDLSFQAPPLYRADMILVSKALARHANAPNFAKQDMLRRLMLNMTFQACGRAGEIMTLSWDLIEWDKRFRVPVAKWMQLKVSKQKPVIFMVGRERHSCLWKGFGDAFIAQVFRPDNGQASSSKPGDDDVDVNWLFPDFAGKSSVGSSLSDWLKQLSTYPNDHKGNRVYEAHRVEELPEGIAAAGLRLGAINEMAPVVQDQQVVQVSGHDFKNLSAVYEYIFMGTLPSLIPGACAAFVLRVV